MQRKTVVWKFYDTNKWYPTRENVDQVKKRETPKEKQTLRPAKKKRNKEQLYQSENR